MLDTHITLFETRDFSLRNTIIAERAATRFNFCCMLEKMFDRNHNILPTKNVGNTSSNMHATRSV